MPRAQLGSSPRIFLLRSEGARVRARARSVRARTETDPVRSRSPGPQLSARARVVDRPRRPIADHRFDRRHGRISRALEHRAHAHLARSPGSERAHGRPADFARFVRRAERAICRRRRGFRVHRRDADIHQKAAQGQDRKANPHRKRRHPDLLQSETRRHPEAHQGRRVENRPRPERLRNDRIQDGSHEDRSRDRSRAREQPRGDSAPRVSAERPTTRAAPLRVQREPASVRRVRAVRATTTPPRVHARRSSSASMATPSTRVRARSRRPTCAPTLRIFARPRLVALLEPSA